MTIKKSGPTKICGIFEIHSTAWNRARFPVKGKSVELAATFSRDKQSRIQVETSRESLSAMLALCARTCVIPRVCTQPKSILINFPQFVRNATRNGDLSQSQVPHVNIPTRCAKFGDTIDERTAGW